MSLQTINIIAARGRAFLSARANCSADFLIMYALAIRVHMLDSFCMVLKGSLRWIPFVGPALSAIGFVFLSRNWETDRDKLRVSFRGLKTSEFGFWLASHPEGTRWNPKKLAESNEFARAKGLPETKHVLAPRVKGFYAALSTLRDHPGSVLDMTIAYESRPANILGFLTGTAAAGSFCSAERGCRFVRATNHYPCACESVLFRFSTDYRGRCCEVGVQQISGERQTFGVIQDDWKIWRFRPANTEKYNPDDWESANGCFCLVFNGVWCRTGQFVDLLGRAPVPPFVGLLYFGLQCTVVPIWLLKVNIGHRLDGAPPPLRVSFTKRDRKPPHIQQGPSSLCYLFIYRTKCRTSPISSLIPRFTLSL